MVYWTDIADQVILQIISICLALLFAIAATHKLRAPAIFTASMQAYRLLPGPLVPAMSVLLIVLELLATLLVLVPSMRFEGFVILAVLLSSYTIGIGINLYRGRTDIDCGCNGPASKQPISGWLVMRNLFLLSGIASGLLLAANSLIPARPLNWLGLLTIAFGVLACAGLYLAFNQLINQLPRLALLRNEA